MGNIKITYYGHSCFTIETDDYSIALDPFDGHVPGYSPLKVSANKVMCSHEHADHNYIEAVNIIRGGQNPFAVTEIHSYHDPEKGALRGTNIIRIFEYGGKRIAHFGDIGVRPTDEQAEMLKGLDAVMIPVGGTYTLDAKEEKALMNELQPKLIIPMHYRLGKYGFGNILELSAFTDQYENVVFSDSSELVLDDQRGVTVLKFKAA